MREQAVHEFDQGMRLFSLGKFVEAERHFLKAAEFGYLSALLPVARIRALRNDENGEKSVLNHLKKAADAGDATANYALHLALRATTEPVVLDEPVRSAAHYLQQAAELGDAFAQAQLANDYLSGVHTGCEDRANYEHWITKAIDQGVDEAVCSYGEYAINRGLRLDDEITHRLRTVRDSCRSRAREILVRTGKN